MTTINGSGSSHRAGAEDHAGVQIPSTVTVGSTEELLMQAVAMLDDQRSQARKARSAGRELQLNAARDRIGNMREAAAFKLASACVSGVATAASGALGGDESAEGNYAAGAGKVDSGVLDFCASEAEANSQMDGVREGIARNGAEDGNDDMQEASQRMNSAMQKLDAILQAEVDAARAAVRG